MKQATRRAEVLIFKSHVAKLGQQMELADPELHSSAGGETGSDLMREFEWPYYRFRHLAWRHGRHHIRVGINGSKYPTRIYIGIDGGMRESFLHEEGEIPTIHT